MAIIPRVITRVVTTAGTRVKLFNTRKEVAAVVIQAKSGNSGNIFVGDNQVSSTLGIKLVPGSNITLSNNDVGSGEEGVDLSGVWLDTDSSADGVMAMWMEVSVA